MLQKRHYEMFARVLDRARPGRLDDMRMIEQWRVTVRLFADMLANDNPRFSRKWFENACQEGEMDRPPSVARRERDRPEAAAVKAAYEKREAERAKRRTPDAPEMTVQEIRESVRALRRMPDLTMPEFRVRGK